MNRRLALLFLDLEIALISLRWLWTRCLLRVACFILGTTVAEVRRRAEWRRAVAGVPA
jgi:hypothetical protein